MTERRAVVSVHDATPAHEGALRRLFALLAGHGVSRTSILVVPSYHGRWDLRRYPAFVDRLARLESVGHEIVLHGLVHDEAPGHSRTVWRRLVRRFYSSEGEFYGLGYTEALRRIRLGLGILGEAGFRPDGFVAPAWLQGEGTVRAARDAGLRYLTTLRRLVDLGSGAAIPAPAVCFSSRSALRARITSLHGALLSRWTASDAVVRIAVHPGDVERPEILFCLERILRRAREARTFVAYRDLLAGGA